MFQPFFVKMFYILIQILHDQLRQITGIFQNVFDWKGLIRKIVWLFTSISFSLKEALRLTIGSFVSLDVRVSTLITNEDIHKKCFSVSFTKCLMFILKVQNVLRLSLRYGSLNYKVPNSKVLITLVTRHPYTLIFIGVPLSREWSGLFRLAIYNYRSPNYKLLP
jgi:hypothetical protein